MERARGVTIMSHDLTRMAPLEYREPALMFALKAQKYLVTFRPRICSWPCCVTVHFSLFVWTAWVGGDNQRTNYAYMPPDTTGSDEIILIAKSISRPVCYNFCCVFILFLERWHLISSSVPILLCCVVQSREGVLLFLEKANVAVDSFWSLFLLSLAVEFQLVPLGD